MKTVLCLILLTAPAAADNAWCLQQARDESNNLVFVIANRAEQKFAHKADYPWIVDFTVTTLHQNKNGHPTDEEAAVLNALEDHLSGALEQATGVHYVGRATIKGSRELVYYVKDAAQAKRVLVDLAKRPQPRSWKFDIAKDAQWKRLDQLLGPDPECL